MTTYQWEIDRLVMADRERPCLYKVAGPCFHPRCLEAHAETIGRKLREQRAADEATVTHIK
jgi:hypothetical protein